MKQKGKLPKILLLLFIILLLADYGLNISREIVIQGFFTNDDYNFFPASKIEKEYSKFLQLNNREKLNFEDDLYIDLGSAKDLPVASNSKIMAYTASKELDFLVTKEEVMLHYLKGFALENLEDYVDSSLYSELFYNKDGNKEYKAVAINMKKSRFIKNDENGKDYYLIIPANSQRKIAVKEFLEWAFSY